MAYVIFNIQTEKLYHKKAWGGYTTYETSRGANTVCNKMNRAEGSNDWMVITDKEWHALPVKMKRVKSLMTGTEIEIPEDTPAVCDPSTETYWSM